MTPFNTASARDTTGRKLCLIHLNRAPERRSASGVAIASVLVLALLAWPSIGRSAAPVDDNGLPQEPCNPPTPEAQLPPGLSFTARGRVTEGCGSDRGLIGYRVEAVALLSLTEMCTPVPHRTYQKQRLLGTAVTDNLGAYSVNWSSNVLLPEVQDGEVLGTLKVRVRVLNQDTGDLLKQTPFLTETPAGSGVFNIEVAIDKPLAPTLLTDRMSARWTHEEDDTDYKIAWRGSPATNVDRYEIEVMLDDDWHVLREVKARHPGVVTPLPPVADGWGAAFHVHPGFDNVYHEGWSWPEVACGTKYCFRVAAVNACGRTYSQEHCLEARWSPPQLKPGLVYEVLGSLEGCLIRVPEDYRVEVEAFVYHADEKARCPGSRCGGASFKTLSLGDLDVDEGGAFYTSFSLDELLSLVPAGRALRSIFLATRVVERDSGQRVESYSMNFNGELRDFGPDIMPGYQKPYQHRIWAVLMPPRPFNLRITNQTSNSITLAWDHADPNGQIPTHYEVYAYDPVFNRCRRPDDGEALKSTSSLSATITDLKPDTEYFFGVRAVYSCGTSGSAAVEGRTAGGSQSDDGKDTTPPGCNKAELGFFTSGLIITPPFPKAHEPFSVYWEIANFGTEETGPFRDLVELNNGKDHGGETFTHSFPSIPANAGLDSVWWRKIDHPGLPGGRHHWWYVYLDPDNRVDECNTHSNVTSYGMWISGIMAAPGPNEEEPQEFQIRGDINGDGVVDDDDVAFVRGCVGERFAAFGVGRLPPCVMADLDGDGEVTEHDVAIAMEEFTGPLPVDSGGTAGVPPAREAMPEHRQTDDDGAADDPSPAVLAPPACGGGATVTLLATMAGLGGGRLVGQLPLRRRRVRSGSGTTPSRTCARDRNDWPPCAGRAASAC